MFSIDCASGKRTANSPRSSLMKSKRRRLLLGCDNDAENISADNDVITEEESEKRTVESDHFCRHFECNLGEQISTATPLEFKVVAEKDPNLKILGSPCLQYKSEFSGSTDLSGAPLKQFPNLKKSLLKNFGSTKKTSKFEYTLFSLMSTYTDLYYPRRTFANAERIRLMYCLHTLNHVLKARRLVAVNNTRLKSNPDGKEFRDQGLTRPRVLIIVPFRDSVLKLVNMFSKLIAPTHGSFVNNKKRFKRDFSELEPAGEQKYFNKPDDYRQLFAGNIDDHFRIGIGVSKKSLKLYADFYRSDVIIASLLGLRTLIANDNQKESDSDFLSSVELLIIDQAETLLMQNWNHLCLVLRSLNKQPREAHGVDFSRVRMWALHELNAFYRQTLVFSHIDAPEIGAVISKQSLNFDGRVLFSGAQDGGGVLKLLVVNAVQQRFQRFSCSSALNEADERFEYFTNRVLPRLKDHAALLEGHVVIFISNYFDYVRLRNYFSKNEPQLDVALANEYTSDKKLSRQRSKFFHGHMQFMLYTERLHYYHRFKIRGARRIYFYQLPRFAHFYAEVGNWLLEEQVKGPSFDLECSVLYSRYDWHRLVAVVGLDRATQLVESSENSFVFTTD